MTSSPLLTIGAFARAVGLTASALRHYDECGLLPPAEVDDATGYRYYTPDLAARARLIVLMRAAGVPIEVMRRVLDGPAGEAGAVLTALVEERATDAARARAVLCEVLGEDAATGARARVDARSLAAALRQVRPAADGDPTTQLSTVLVDVAADGVDVVATNRYWMAIRSLQSGEAAGSGRVVLGLADAARLADGLDDHDIIDLELADGRLGFGDELPAVVGRTTPYPAHRLLVAGLEPAITRAVAPTRGLADAVARSGRAEVVLELGTAAIAVAADDAPRHELAAAVSGPDLTVRMGSALLQRALGACLGAEVLLEVAAGDRAVRLSSPYQPGFLALVMPAPR
ncbi:MerR family transcriptional regulator [Nocardioides sp. YIM 152315]|uniref:MerR family transcriptional regulator n=1 Tax=Nocardioides sp. YIM 152315 TaxID=3031760 RepID=UPI0023DB2935|nr:MerR family transcriptional regulator [Nocardioides sp. YIM 152315]MDF1603871.1 MerR family transcriptional regulator [Nocardioides sp. YIM 152315]